jgi:hypothetical protein
VWHSAEWKHHQKFDVKRHPEKAEPTVKKLRAKDHRHLIESRRR